MLVAATLFWRAWLASRPPLIDIGGQRLEARVQGTGRPPVVFEAGFEGAMHPFEALQASVAEHTQTLVYQRAGYGRSDAGPPPRTAQQAARDLRGLLTALGIRPPVVLVCYGVGCLFSRVFAHDYPSEIAGLVFIDAASASVYADPRARQALARNLTAGARREWAALAATVDEARSAWPLPSVPYVVITAMKPNGAWPLVARGDMDAWLKEQQALLGRLGGPTHIIFPKADHVSVLNEKDVARAIVELAARIKAQS